MFTFFSISDKDKQEIRQQTCQQLEHVMITLQQIIAHQYPASATLFQAPNHLQPYHALYQKLQYLHHQLSQLAPLTSEMTSPLPARHSLGK